MKALSHYLTTFLLLSSASGVISQQKDQNICHLSLPQSPFNENICQNKYPSICSSGDYFWNKIHSKYNLQDPLVLKTQAERKKCDQAAGVRAQAFADQLYMVRESVFNNVSEEIFQKWVKYIGRMAPFVERTKMIDQGTGLCSEAARTSIVNSLLNQLKTGMRESAQFISLTGTKPDGSPALHSIAIFNAPLQVSDNHLSTQKLRKTLQDVMPTNSNNPVVICDAWADIHDVSSNWLKLFAKEKSQAYVNVNWSKMEVADCSLPSLRDGLNSLQRNYLKNFFIDLLTVSNEVNNNLLRHS